MGRLEDSLRETLADKVADLSPGEGVADQVIHNARRVRLRRAVGVPVAAGLAAVLVAMGAVTVAGGWGDPAPKSPVASASPDQPTPGPSTAPTNLYAPLDLPVDVLTADGLILAAHEGGTHALPKLPGDVDAAWRLQQGYLVRMRVGVESQSLWLVPQVAAPVQLATGSGILVTAGTTRLPGVRVAWVDDTSLNLGVLSDAAITDVVSTPAPVVYGHVRLRPQAVVGGAVILAGTQTGGGLDTWDYWFPDRGDFTRHDHGRSLSMQGRTSDGERLIAHLRADGGSCLAEVDPDGFLATRTVCPSPFWDLDRIVPSPDGRWVFVNGEPQLFGSAVYRASDVWAGSDLTYAAAATGPSYGGGAAWTDDGTLVTVDNAQVTTLNPDDQAWSRVLLPTGIVSPRLIPVL